MLLVINLRLLLSNLVEVGWDGSIRRMSASDLLRMPTAMTLGTGALINLESVVCGLVSNVLWKVGLVVNPL